MKMNDALILRDRFFRGETTIDEERRLVSYLLADDCPEELAADRHAILMLAKEDVITEMSKEPGSQRSDMTLSAEMAKEQGSQRSDVSPKAPFLLRLNRLRRIAAILIAAIFLGGLSFAAYRAFSPAKEQQPAEESALNPQPSTLNPSPEGLVRFSNVRLDSILTTVSAHYGKRVCFRSEEPRGMKLITTWNPADTLAAFIDHLNMFDYLHLTLQGDTIFVEQTGEED